MNVYLPQRGDVVTPGALASGAISQFQGFLAACGEAAAEVVYAIQDRVRPSGLHLDTMLLQLRNQGLAGSQGTTGLRGVATALTESGVPSTVFDNWRTALAQFTGRTPLVLLFQNAQALPGETPGLRGHFGTVVGFQPATQKFIVAAGNTPAAKAGRYNLYSAAQLAAADPIGAVVPTGAPRLGGDLGSRVFSALGGGASAGTPPPAGTQLTPQQVAAWVNQLATQGTTQFIQNPVGATGTALGATAGQALGFTGQAIGSGIAAGFGAVGTSFLHAFGINSAKDLAFRTVLIIGGALILILSLLALFLGAANRASNGGAGQAAEVAAVAAA